MRENLLRNWATISARHPIRIIITVCILTLLALLSASRLTMTARFSDLLPEKDPLVKEFNNIIKEYTSASNTIVVVWGDEMQIKTFADKIVPRIENLKDYVKRVDYKIDEGFLSNHGLILVKASDLKKTVRIFDGLDLLPLITHINDNMEETYVGNEESLSDKEKEDNAIRSLDGLEFWIDTMKLYASADSSTDDLSAEKAVKRFMLGDPYFISPDKRTLLIFVEPNFSALDVDKVVASTDTIQTIVNNLLTHFPSVKAGLTGTVPLSRDEYVYTQKDMRITSVVAMILVLLLFILSFRMITAPLLAALNLIVSIIFASGVIAIFIHTLNIMTSMFAVILIGLGVDFSIHIISLYYERRALGDNPEEAMVYTLTRSGAGITIGALTTAVSFFSMMISESRGIKETGLVLGVGIISVMLLTLLLMPSLLILRENIIRRLGLKSAQKPISVEFGILGKVGGVISHHPRLTLSVGILFSLFMLYQAFHSRFDYNYLNMEPKGIPSVALQDSMITAFEMSPDFVMITTPTVDDARRITEKAKEVPTVSKVESISDFIPSRKQQSVRTPYLIQVRKYLDNNRTGNKLRISEKGSLISQIKRLDDNIYEIGQMAFVGGQDRVDAKCKQIIGDPNSAGNGDKINDLIKVINENPEFALRGLNRFQKEYEPKLFDLSWRIADTSRITIDKIPPSILDRFINKRGDRYLVTITPKEQVWNFEFLGRFTEQMQRIDKHITGMPPIFLRLVQVVGRDGKLASALAVLSVFLLLLMDFRKISLTLIAMTPLILGAVWMVGLMTTVGLPFTFVNVMGIPLIIGIGIDDGVHLLHRYRVEGYGKSEVVLKSTGKAILLTSLTTMAGFGSLLLAKYRGFGSLGSLLFLGVAACFITTVLFLPALVSLLHKD